MAKGKRSEGNREKISSVAQQLFHYKGYDNTTMQDTIDGLGGMTKGVISHYFKSKAEIMQCLMNSF
jgi:Transcriptional regulator